ncbi:MAG TPA: cytochrome C oxidase subunit IV family protein [Pyrinomonadaceae bacterium]|nr:cytochrome C oxidase subunit IV family protein [Pyrinomonadaceae bacterium]
MASIRELFRKSDVILMGLCVLLAAGFLVLAATSAATSGSLLTIDNIFFTGACLLLALTFIAVPALTLRERGMLKNPFVIAEGVPPARAAEHVHFEGSTGLFFKVLLALLVLTLVEVVLAYIQIQDLRIMLTILMGLSLIKAAAIMAYFMHLKFERMSLVATLVPTLVVCICLLFIVFPDSFRTGSLRATPTATAPTAPGESPH